MIGIDDFMREYSDNFIIVSTHCRNVLKDFLQKLEAKNLGVGTSKLS